MVATIHYFSNSHLLKCDFKEHADRTSTQSLVIINPEEYFNEKKIFLLAQKLLRCFRI